MYGVAVPAWTGSRVFVGTKVAGMVKIKAVGVKCSLAIAVTVESIK
jgi:hypothetical protein